MSDIKEEIEERKGMIVIGMISSGKSTFLNSIFGINYLETNNDITTKFICAIRYNPKLKEPIFYNLKLVPKKDKINEYIYMKNGKEFSGEINIKNKISSINKREHSFSEPKYETLFWMLEINKIIIENEEFMKTFDFYDIPGLNEYIKGDKNLNQENSNENNIINNLSEEVINLDPPPTINKIIDNNKTEETKKDIIDKTPKEEKCNDDYKYIKGIFKYLKGKIENFCFIISTESCYKPQNLGIITEIRKNIDFNFEGGLFVLTKIDLSENKEKKIEECKQYFINHISSDIFNIDFNVFVPLNSIQFNIEMYMKKDIKYYFLYYYRKYYDNYVIVSGSKDIELTFIDFLENEIKKNIGENQFEDFIEEAKENFNMEDLNKIKKTYEEIKENTNQTIKFGINFENDDEDNESINILKALYKLFKDEKYFPEFSESTKEIINYFKDYKKETPTGILKEIKSKKKSDLDINIENLNDIFNKLKQYIDEDENNKNSNTALINSNLRKLEKYIKNGKNIYIPFIGISSAGKSTILNCIIGFQLFPESDKECTTRGIITKYGKEVELFEVKVQTVKNFYVFEKDKLISKGVKKVQDYLKCLNYQYGKDESKYFYLIKTPIKLFDDYKFNDELKEKILLVDLPGCDTSDNKFNEHDKIERTVYEKLLDISSSFVFVNKNRAITDLDNKKILNNTYNTIYDNSSLGHNYLKNCLFLINMFTNLSDNEKNINNIKMEISNILFDNKKEENNKEKLKNINVCLFNAKKYMEFLKERDKLCDKYYLFNEFKNYFFKKKRTKNFVKFFYDSLKTRCKDISLTIDENFECDDKFYLETKNTILELMKTSNIKYDELESKYFKNISNILFYINYKIKEIKLYGESNCVDFFNSLERQIRKAKNYVDSNFFVNIKKCFKYFDMVFNKEIEKEKSFNQKEFKTKTEEIINELDELKEKFTIERIFDKCMKKIDEVFNKIKENKESLITQYNKDIKKLVKIEIEEKIKEILEKDLNSDIEKTMNELDKEVSESKNKLLDLFKLGLKKEIKKGKYKAEIEVIINFSFYEKLKLNLSHFGFEGISYWKILISIGSIIATCVIFDIYIIGITILLNLGPWILGKFKAESKIFDEKIEEASLKYYANFERTRRKFSRLYSDTLSQTKFLFQDLLSVASIDLSKTEEVEWNNLKVKYNEIKNNIYSISNEKIDLFK